jgi:hypothetical protein
MERLFKHRLQHYLLQRNSPLTSTLPSFACQRSLPTENAKAAIADDAETVSIQRTAARRLPPCRRSPGPLVKLTKPSHPFVERLIGTIRREYRDHVFFWNDRNLERKLVDFANYYN